MAELFYFSSETVQMLKGIGLLFLVIVLCHGAIKLVVRRIFLPWFRSKDSYIRSFLLDDYLVLWIFSLPYLAIIYQGLQWIPNIPPALLQISHRLLFASIIVAFLLIFSRITKVIDQIYSRRAISRSRPIKGYLQGLQLLAFLLGFICIPAVLLDKSPLLLMSGLGALTAILMLVFKDTILSFVAGIQLTTNDLLRVGDWVEIPQFNADGDVLEITLHTVKVQNWDMTVTVIPAHKFLEHSFKNWRGMQDSGGRRIKRSLYIDVSSIRFLTEEDISHLLDIALLKNYLGAKLKELTEAQKSVDPRPANRRRLTNIGTFRAYLTEYLRQNSRIHQRMTLMVRQLQPGAEGLPLEIYVFTNDIRWEVYEQIQADIFDHAFAILSEFDLRSYQQPSGHDFQSLQSSQASSPGLSMKPEIDK